MREKDSNNSEGGQLISFPGEAIDKSLADVINKTFGAAGDGVINTTKDIFGGFIGDYIQQWRMRRALSLAADTADIMKKRGIDASKARDIPISEWYILFESATKEENQELGRLWAALLANALDPNSSVYIEKDLTAVLGQLTPKSAKLLEFIYSSEDIIENCKNEIASSQEKEKIESSGKDLKSSRIRNRYYIEERVRIIGAAKSIIETKFSEIELKSKEEIAQNIGNLVRLGLIYHRTKDFILGQAALYHVDFNFHEIEAIELSRIVGNTFENVIDVLVSGFNEENYGGESIIQGGSEHSMPVISYGLLPFGRRLMVACDAEIK